MVSGVRLARFAMSAEIHDQNIVSLCETGYITLEDFPGACESVKLQKTMRKRSPLGVQSKVVYKNQRLVG